jgi:hypothetical protein
MSPIDSSTSSAPTARHAVGRREMLRTRREFMFTIDAHHCVIGFSYNPGYYWRIHLGPLMWGLETRIWDDGVAS